MIRKVFQECVAVLEHLKLSEEEEEVSEDGEVNKAKVSKQKVKKKKRRRKKGPTKNKQGYGRLRAFVSVIYSPPYRPLVVILTGVSLEVSPRL